MYPNQQHARLIIRHCDEYVSEPIRVIVREALEELNLRPSGRTLLKPNIMMAGEEFKHFVWKSKMLVKKLGGHKCQIPGPTQRGEAAPVIESSAAE